MAAGTPTPLPTQTQVYQIIRGGDDVNENDTFSPGDNPAWIGNANPTPPISILGLRYTNVSIPAGAQIVSAKLEVTAPYAHWHNISVNMYGENTGNSSAFSETSRPSMRVLTKGMVNYTDDMQWNTGTWYSLGEINTIVQEIVNRSDWTSGNSMSFILVGVADHYNRKFISSFETSPSQDTRLTVNFRPASSATPTVIACNGSEDVNCDGSVNMNDVFQLLGNYGKSEIGNLHIDGIANMMDAVQVIKKILSA